MFDSSFAENFNQKMKEKGWTHSVLSKGTKAYPYQINRIDGTFCCATTGRQFPLQGNAYKTKSDLLLCAGEYIDIDDNFGCVPSKDLIVKTN